MRISAAVFFVCALVVGVSLGHPHGGGAFHSGIIGSTPGLMIGGIASGGAPWTVSEASATLAGDGNLEVEIHGLVITSQGNPGPVTQVAASLVCGGSGGTVATTTDAVDLDSSGDAHIEAHITPPTPCFGTIILVRVAGTNGTSLGNPLPQSAPFIAATGLGAQTSKGHGDGEGDGQGDN